MEDVYLIWEGETAIYSDAIDDHIEFFCFITVPWIGHISVPLTLSGFLFHYSNVSLLENVSHIVSEQPVHLILYNVYEAHFGQTLHDNLIIAKVCHLEDSLASRTSSSLSTLEINAIEFWVNWRVVLVGTDDHICGWIDAEVGVARA